MRVAVTGSSGRLGTQAVVELREAGHDVVGLDLTPSTGPGSTRVDLADYGQTLDALLGITARHTGLDAVVHLAAIPVNGLLPDAETYLANSRASFDVLFGAVRAGIRRLVVASSITAMGFPFEVAPPRLPVDEGHTAAFTTYGLGKVVDETLCAQLAGWHPELSITALRFTNIVGPDEWDGFARAGEPDYRRDLIGSYVDLRDSARAVRLALEASTPGFEVLTVAAPDSGLTIPSRELAELWFPGTPVADGLAGHASLLAVDRARERLGFTAEHLWRDQIGTSRT